jgi:hypothetical protein
VPPLGILGAAAALLVGYGVLTLAYLWVSQRLWAIRVETRRVVVVVLVLAGVTVVTTTGMDAPLGLRLLVPIGYVVLCTAGAGVRPAEREALAGLRRLVRRS